MAALKAEQALEELHQEEEEAKRRKMNPLVRMLVTLLDFVNTTTVQTVMYIVFVFVFQMLAETVRNPKLEYYYDKFLSDTFIENHFDSSHNTFESIRRVADIWEWGNTVLWPGFFANLGPCDSALGSHSSPKTCNDEVWPDGDGSFHLDGATPFTVPELVAAMDILDWTEGLIIKQGRVNATAPESCETEQLSGVCYPELQAYGPLITGGAREDKRSFGFNWTTDGATPLTHPWSYMNHTTTGANSAGQMSAAVPSMRMMPTGGFVSVIIPFFSTTWLPEEEGVCDPAAGEVTWYRETMVNRTSANKRAAFYCVRLSWNGERCHQLCDPTNIGVEQQMLTLAGRNTGVVRKAVELFWNDMKRAHYIDSHTRVITILMHLRSNHIGIRYRVTLMFELTSLGAVLPSYDTETLVEDQERLDTMLLFKDIALGLCLFFVSLEGIEVVKSGVIDYFSDMWNIMDWLNFTIFFMVYATLGALLKQIDERGCHSPICQTVGFEDDWRVMGTARIGKIYLSLCVCIQLLKIIKFTNVLIPKMSLMTAVLSKGLADLACFGIVFIISMLAFSMMFYVQLGSVMEDFNDQIASFISLARALFGDFDIDDIMNNSSGYLNAVLFLVYLFVAVFILLSMFLAILGESQAAAREDQDAEKEAGTAPPDYGVLYEAAQLFKRLMAVLRPKKKDDAAAEDGAADGGGGGAAEEEGDEVKQLKEQLAISMGDLRDDVKAIAEEVARMAEPAGAADGADGAGGAGGAGGGYDDARALRKVVQALEQRMTSRLTLIDEKIARGGATRRKKKASGASGASGAGATPGTNGTASEGDAVIGSAPTPVRKRRTNAAQATAERVELMATDDIGDDPMAA